MAKQPKPSAAYLKEKPEQPLNWDALDSYLASAPAAAAANPESPGMLRSLGDSALAAGSGLVTGVKLVSDAFGADNPVSRTLGDLGGGMQGLLSDARKAELQNRAKLIKEAEDSGSTLKEVGAYLGGFAEAPVDTLLNVAGTAAPTMAAMLLPGAREATAARLLGVGVGAVQGAGAGKASIYDAVLRQKMEEGMPEEQARAIANEAQAYAGKNADTIAANAALGAVAGGSGLESAARSLRYGKAAAQAVPGMARRVATGALIEGVPEAGQGGLEQASANIAMQREGYDVPTMRGVAGSAALEGAAGGALGAGFAIPTPADIPAPAPAPAPIVPESGPLTRAANAGAPVAAKLQAEAATSQALTRMAALADEEGAAPAFDTPPASPAGAYLATPKPTPEQEAAAEQALEAERAQNEIARTSRPRPVPSAQDQEQTALANIAKLPSLPLEDAQRIYAESTKQGKDMALVQHPDGDYTVAPRRWVTQDMAKQGQQQARKDEIEAAPVERAPRRRTDAVELDPVELAIGAIEKEATPAARAFVQEYRAGRVSADEVMARGKPADPVAALGNIKPAAEPGGLILTASGLPFKNKRAATLARDRQQNPADFEVKPVEGGFVVQPATPATETRANVTEQLPGNDAGSRSTDGAAVSGNLGVVQQPDAAGTDAAGAASRTVEGGPADDAGRGSGNDALSARWDALPEADRLPVLLAAGWHQGSTATQRMGKIKWAKMSDSQRARVGQALEAGNAAAPQSTPKAQAGQADQARGTEPAAEAGARVPGARDAAVEADGVKRRAPKGNADALEALEAGERIVLNEGTEYEEEIWVEKTKDEKTYVVKSREKGSSTTFTKGPVGPDRQWGWGKGDAAREAIKGKGIGEAAAPAPTEPLSPLTRALNDLADVEARIEQQGRVVDDRLVSRRNQLRRIVKELQDVQRRYDVGDDGAKGIIQPALDAPNAEAESLTARSGADAGQTDDTMADPEMAAYEGGKSSKTRAQDKAKVAEDAARAKASANTVFTEDAAAAARARLKAKLNGGNKQRGGIDPEVFSDGVILAGYHIEKGARTFAAYVKAMLEDMGDTVKPYLKAWYMGVKFDPRGAGLEGMDSAADVEAADVDALLAEPAPAPEPDKAPDDARPSLDGAEGRNAVAQSVANRLIGGEPFATILDARKFVAELTGQKIEPGTRAAKMADETVEMGVALAARDIVRGARKQGRSDEVIYKRLVALYEAQPSLNVRDSDSIRNQAYSTPAPLAFVASRLAQIQAGQKVGEPTAGNGMLVMEVAPENAVLNELNPDRAGNLEAMGFERVRLLNAAINVLAPAKSLDAVVMNPPFGAVRDDDGETIKYEVLPNFTTGEVDHAIVFKALEAMKDDGNAVLIIGGTLAESVEGRKDAYRGKAKREFFYNLHQQYNVVDHFTVGGDLYKKQGTTYPVDVIVIRGRGASARALPAANLPPIIETWAQLQEKLNADFGGVGARGPGDSGRNRSEVGQPADPRVVPEPSGVQGAANGDASQPGRTDAGAKPADGGRAAGGSDAGRGAGRIDATVGEPGSSEPAARTGDPRPADGPAASAAQQPGSRGGAASDNASNVGERTGGQLDRTRLSDEDAGKLQVKYNNFSGNKSVNTLVPTSHLSALQNAFENLRKRVGPIDTYVRERLQYDEAGFKKAFSAEQVEALALAIDNIERGRGFIIGDQTGIGKGRVVAAMIRYAKLNGKTPVFVTQMPDLYGDMMRDLNDIGMAGFKPLMTNNNASVPLDAEALDWFTETQGIKTRIAELEDAIAELVADDFKDPVGADELATAVKKAMKASTNPEVVSLRDEIADLKESMPKKRGKFLDTPAIDKHEAELARMVSEGGIGDYGAIFTTYNQMAALDSGAPKRAKDGTKIPASAPKFAYRDTFLNAMVNQNAMLILDESHNAGEAGDGKFPKVGDTVRNLVSKAGSAFYSSATFAKNPAVMDVYSKTDLGRAFATPDELANAIRTIPQQQVASAMLVEAGQYIRRERSFDGIEYKTQTVEGDTHAAEDVSTAMRLMVEFDEAKKAAIADIQNDLDAEGAVMAATGGGMSSGAVTSTNFTGVMHNVVNTFLLALKADAAADVAIDAIKRGEKPVLTVANTMELFITDYAQNAGLGIGSELNATFADVLMRYLEKTRMARIRHANGDEEVVRLSDRELGPDAVQVYESAREFIQQMSLSIPLSPIDHIKERIRAAGYVIGEVTGRQTVVEGGVIRPRNKAELNTAGKKNTIAKFNGGQIDALIINRSGSTGLSMHASETFADQRRRVMVIAQAELDINNHMQMLGRTNRTGQVTQAPAKLPKGPATYGLPRYVQLSANVPIELRPAAVLAAKMAGLNANTTAGRKSAVEDSSALDFMNKYGDEVAASIVGNDAELNQRLGWPVFVDDNGVPSSMGAAARVTGRIGLLPLREQSAIYDRINTEYRELIAQLDAMGRNDLEAKTYPLDAKVTATEEVAQGDDTSPFTAPVVAERMEVRKLGKPYTSEKVRALVSEALTGKTAEQYRSQIIEQFRKDARDEVTALQAEAAKAPNPAVANAQLEKRKHAMQDAFTRFVSVAPRLGEPVVIKTAEGNIYGVPIALDRKKGAKSVTALSSWQVAIAVVDGARVMRFPLSQVFAKDGETQAESAVVIQPASTMNVVNADRTGFDEVPVIDAFDRGQTDAREVRTIMTGNLLRASAAFPGRLISFTTADGSVRQGLLTPATFDLKAAQAKMTPVLNDPAQIVSFLEAGGRVVDRETGGEILSARKIHKFEISTSKTGKGKKIATDAGLYMVSSGSRMRANIWPNADTPAELRDFFEKVLRTVKVALTTSADTKDLLAGDKGTKFSRAKRPPAGITLRDAQAAADLIRRELPNAPEIIVVDSLADVPGDLQNEIRNRSAEFDWEAVYHTDRKIYVMAPHFDSLDRFMFVVGRHEVRHAGLDAMLGERKDEVMLSIGRANRRVMMEARKLMADGLAGSFTEGVEEALADMPVEEVAALSRVKILTAAIRRWLRATAYKLRKAGWNRLADSIEPKKWTDNDVIAFVLKAENVSRAPAGNAGAAQFSRAVDAASSAFRRWFGDSKVVDANGEPLVVYHGTAGDFSEFSPDFAGSTTYSASGLDGFFFTEDADTASKYAKVAQKIQHEMYGRFYSNANVMPVYLAISNPLVYRKQRGDASTLMDTLKRRVIADAKAAGHDGVVFQGFKDTPNGRGDSANVYVAFHPEQIKSATGNNGDFDPENPDIRFSRARTVINDEGRPEFVYGDTKLAFPIPTERLEVIPSPGQSVMQYAIMPTEGFDVLGHVDLLLENGKPVSLLDIEAYSRRKGAGRQVIETLLRAFPDSDLNISNIVPEAQGFWEKMGVPVQNLEDGAAYDGTLNLETFLQAQDDGRAQANPRRAGEANRRADTGAARRASEANQGWQVASRFSRPRSLQTLRDAGARQAEAVRDVSLFTGYKVGDFIESTGKLSWWDKSIGTPFNLAKRHPGTFGRVFNAVQDFLSDVSFYATESANLAPRLLPKLETIKDLAKQAISPADNKAIAAPIFEGTLTWTRDRAGKPITMEQAEAAAERLSAEEKAQELLKSNLLDPKVLRMWQGLPQEQYEAAVSSRYTNQLLRPGVVWTDEELRSKFNLADEQIALYKEFRATVDRSLDDLTVSEIVRLVRSDLPGARQKEGQSADDFAMEVRDALFEAGEDKTADKVVLMANRLKDLKTKGYAPLSRFGHFTLDVVDKDGERAYFGMFESQAEANRMARKKAQQFPGATITQGTQSNEAYKMLAGVSPETIELFGEILGLDMAGDSASDQAFQEYLKKAKSTRSAMKRLIHRKGIDGFSEEVGRVLAGFVTSNARRTSSNHHLKGIMEAVEAMPKEQGELKDYAAKMAEYVNNPVEEAQALRGLMFAQYLGGSVASALVNMTQPIAVTLPFLSQHTTAAKAAKAVTQAFADMAGRKKLESGLAEAMKLAEDKGIVAPQEIHYLQAQARGAGALVSGDGTRAGDALARAQNGLSKLAVAWGKLFGFAELVNRRATFIAAYRVAVDKGVKDPFKFAADAVEETQFVYNKGNRPQWARGAIGATLFTFKTYSISYIELLSRMWKQGGPEGKKAFALALAVMVLMSGVDELPFMEDAEDLVDGFAQKVLGLNWQTKTRRQEFMANVLGKDLAEFLGKGISGVPGVPIDVSGRLGMGNLIPGTGLLRGDSQSMGRDVAEIAGPVADLIKRGGSAVGMAAQGDIGKAALEASPVAVRNVAKAVDMGEMGMYRDATGKKVIDTTMGEAVLKGIGFQPNTVAKVQEASLTKQRMIALNKSVESEIADQWALGRFENDPAKVEAARNRLKAWNRDNPDSPIRIEANQIQKRVKAMRASKQERIEKTAPKELRAAVRRELVE